MTPEDARIKKIKATTRHWHQRKREKDMGRQTLSTLNLCSAQGWLMSVDISPVGLLTSLAGFMGAQGAFGFGSHDCKVQFFKELTSFSPVVTCSALLCHQQNKNKRYSLSKI